MEYISFDASLKMEEIMTNDLKEIRAKIREVMLLTKGESCLMDKGDFCKNILNDIWEYSKQNDNVFEKAWVMQGILDNVLSVYFETLMQVEKKLKEANENKL